MQLSRSLKLINRALEEERKEYFYRLWLVRYPSYTEKNYESFDDFYEKCNPRSIVYDMRDKDDIMKELLNKEVSAIGTI